MKIVWSSLAIDRVTEIAQYIAQDSPNSAQKWVESTFKSVERLEKFPKSGRMVPEIMSLQGVSQLEFQNFKKNRRCQRTMGIRSCDLLTLIVA